MAQLECGKAAVATQENPNPLLSQEVKDHAQAADRFRLMLEFMAGLTGGTVKPALLVSAEPEELST